MEHTSSDSVFHVHWSLRRYMETIMKQIHQKNALRSAQLCRNFCYKLMKASLKVKQCLNLDKPSSIVLTAVALCMVCVKKEEKGFVSKPSAF